MSRLANAYEWPEGLYPLRDWMRRKGVDVDNLKSERQALWMAKELGKQSVKMPKRGKPTFPAMLKLQQSLCPKGSSSGATKPREDYEPGTFGAASAVRKIDPKDYEGGS